MAAPSIPEETAHAIGQSEAFLALQERISRAAKTERPVILIGERGTGKELAAARLHLLSQRWNQPYVKLDCASLSPTLIESELFGHEAGAFTGAIRQRKGRFEMADGGSIFLDEAANIPLTAQEKILRVVEYGLMERVGGSGTLEVDVRIIAATNVDLREAARQGRFRWDLLDRLAFEVIAIPPLRNRGEDILRLADHFARHMAGELGLAFQPEFSPKARKQLIEFSWPGNVRELKNTVERAVYRASEPVIGEIEFDPFESPFIPKAAPGHRAPVPADESSSPSGGGETLGEDLDAQSLPEAVGALEIRRLRQALEASHYNQRAAARQLGVTYHQFRNYYKKHKSALG